MRVVLDLPFRGTWIVRNSPARRVPSHGTDLFATTHAVDFVAVDGRRTDTRRDWRTLLATEPPERFVGFGQPILAPASGTVVVVHDGEDDHVARRSPLATIPYAVTQGSRARAGRGALAGNHVVIDLGEDRGHVLLAHLRRASLEVGPGDRVTTGQPVGSCGNSGNSTQPHVHVQAMDDPDAAVAQGLPMAFRDHRVWRRGRGTPLGIDLGMPDTGDVVAPR